MVNELKEEPDKKQVSAAADHRKQDTVNESQNAAAEGKQKNTPCAIGRVGGSPV